MPIRNCPSRSSHRDKIVARLEAAGSAEALEGTGVVCEWRRPVAGLRADIDAQLVDDLIDETSDPPFPALPMPAATTST